jgi:hypothetical protein
MDGLPWPVRLESDVDWPRVSLAQKQPRFVEGNATCRGCGEMGTEVSVHSKASVTCRKGGARL